MWKPRKMNKNMPIDFYARRTHFIDHMADVWKLMPQEIRGTFYIPEVLVNYSVNKGVPRNTIIPLGCRNEKPTSCAEIPFAKNPIVTSAYGDMVLAGHYNERPLILMEHGVGLTFNDAKGKTVSGYGGGEGKRSEVSLFLAPNEYIAKKTTATFPEAPQVIIGTPKLDPWAHQFDKKHEIPDNPTVCISFHWDGSSVAPEAGNAWEYYRRSLSSIKDHYNLYGHGHPKSIDMFTPVYKKLGIPVIKDFSDVMNIADIYVNDCSSTLYEFCVTGKPVVVLNAPWFRRSVQHGIRFWDYSDIGIVCNKPDDLLFSIAEAIDDPVGIRTRRKKYVKELYPNLGYAAQTAAKALKEFCYD